jgi:hypothetical protein
MDLIVVPFSIYLNTGAPGNVRTNAASTVEDIIAEGNKVVSRVSTFVRTAMEIAECERTPIR